MNRKYIGGSIYCKLGMPIPIGIRYNHYSVNLSAHIFFFTFHKTKIGTYFKIWFIFIFSFLFVANQTLKGGGQDS